MKLTQSVVRDMEAETKAYTIWCDQLKGFGVQVNPTGVMTYIAKYRVGGRQKMVSIGRSEKLKAEAARKRAQELMGAAVQGVDTVEDSKVRQRAATVRETADRFVKDYVPFHLKPSTQADYIRSIDKFILPKLGRMKVADLDRATIAAFHQSMSDTPYQAAWS